MTDALLPPTPPGGPPMPPGNDRLLAAFLAKYVAGPSRNTMRSALNTICRVLGSDVTPETFPWSELRAEHTALLRAKLAEGHAPKSAQIYLAALRGILREAWRLGMMSHEDYTRAIDLAPVRGSRLEEGRSLEVAEMDRLFTACEKWSPALRDRNQALLAMGFYLGLRRTEICEAQLEDLKADKIKVIGKGNKEREVPVSSVCAERMNPWLRRRGDRPGPVVLGVLRNGDLNGRALTPMAVTKALAELGEEARVEFTPHDMRRTFATRLLEKGVPLQVVQRLMGHTDPETTLLYDKSGDAQARAAVERLSEDS